MGGRGGATCLVRKMAQVGLSSRGQLKWRLEGRGERLFYAGRATI